MTFSTRPQQGVLRQLFLWNLTVLLPELFASLI